MKVFVDTSAWLAMEITNDQNHLQAKQHIQRLKQKRTLFFTNHYVLSETYTRLIYDVNLKTAHHAHHQITTAAQAGQLHILELESTNLDEVFSQLHKYSDHQLSFTDATIIVNISEYQLDEVFTFDKHFRDINLPTNPL